MQWAVGMLAYKDIQNQRVSWKANKIAQMLIEEGHADVNEIPRKVSKHPTLRHALGEAAFFGNYRLVDYLLDHGADPSIRSDADGLTVWDIACSDGGVPSLTALLGRRGISPATLWGILTS